MRLMALMVALLLLMSGAALAFDPVSIKDTDYRMLGVSRSGKTVLWAWKVKLSNDTETPQDVKLTVQLVDSSDYELAKNSARVHLDMWETKSLTGQGRVQRDLWEKVSKANYLLEMK
jgi:hypothetical protein